MRTEKWILSNGVIIISKNPKTSIYIISLCSIWKCTGTGHSEISGFWGEMPSETFCFLKCKKWVCQGRTQTHDLPVTCWVCWPLHHLTSSTNHIPIIVHWIIHEAYMYKFWICITYTCVLFVLHAMFLFVLHV